MENRNQTSTPEFLLLRLTDDSELQPALISLFLFMCLVTILGNMLIILTFSCSNPRHLHLHTPVYLLLSNLSLNDIFLSTSVIPKMLVNIQENSPSITYRGCLTQMSFVLIFGGLENCLLAVMACDRYMASCHPLRYTVIMNPCFCVLLILLSLLISVVDSLVHSPMVLQLSFCTHLTILSFFCELPQILKLACLDTLIDNILIYVSSCVFVVIPLSGMIFSYAHIVSSILRMSSSEGKYKAFSTCGSHLSVVFLFYGTGFHVYISSAITNVSKKTAAASVMWSLKC
ncbi:olfactory receptor 7G2-like isoform X1 [Nannospalax galili]|uniref:olfactory receptor 7G2-like isoform X1 n=1 Tax=Nannospalax galili TaxID=1026970 RepID=UPI00081A08E0|nr:olfactory receptor 7G2-like isoform X1 [Nannospalax galili]